VRLLFDSLSSCSGLLKHAAATTRPPSPSRLDVQRGAELCARGWTLRSRWAQVAVAETAPAAGAYDTPAVQTEVAAALGAVALAEGDARPPYRCGNRRARRVPLSVGTGNVRVYSPLCRTATVSWSR
jgi:hypothetical protein